MFANDRVAESCEAAWLLTLGDLRDRGADVSAAKGFRELVGFDVVVEDARQRLNENGAREMPLVAAIARFVWMMAGNSRLADIEFYVPQVTGYTDDGLSVPGSSYGARLRGAGREVDQVKAAIARLRGGDDEIAADGSLRRAANVIWSPEDAARMSKDIPCAFGLFYLPRNGVLHTQLAMRSNNALSLLPFNLFEFSLLAEVVAIESGLETGTFRVDAMSMHYFGDDRARVDAVLDAGPSAAPVMPSIDPDSSPLQQINLLARAEAAMRSAGTALMDETRDDLRARGAGLDAYWRPFLEVLMIHALTKAGRLDVGRELAEGLPPWAQRGAQGHLDHLEAQGGGTTEGRLFPVKEATSAAVARELATEAGGERDHLHELLDQIEAEGLRLSRAEGRQLERHLLVDRAAIAARSDQQGSADDHARLTRDEVRAAIRDLGLGS